MHSKATWKGMGICVLAFTLSGPALTRATGRPPQAKPPASGGPVTAAAPDATSQAPAKPAPVSGQTPTTSQPPSTAKAGQAPQQASPGQQQPATQKPTFKVQVELVTTDVIVRDSKGQFIPDLTTKDFEVYEDGVKQDVIQMVLNRGGRQTNIIAPPAAVAEEGILVPAARAPVDSTGRIFIFFIDDLHLEFRNTTRVRKLLEEMQKTLIHDGDLFAIQTTGPSSVAVDLTYDKKRFSSAITRIAGSELKPSEIINGPEGAEGPNEVRYRAHVAFSTVNDLLYTLEQVRNRRKALIYMSDGYDFNPFENARAGIDPTGANVFLKRDTGVSNAGTSSDNTNSNVYDDPFANNAGKIFADADLVRELADLTRTANRANVTMYTIDPRGLVGSPDLDENVNPTEWLDYLRKSQDSLRVLAEQTGGFAVINQNDYSKGLQRIDAETSDYYMLGYYSKNPDPLKRWRNIEVKVTRPNTTVLARKGYQLKRPPKAGTPPAASAK
jgi:VWFA-related protein